MPTCCLSASDGADTGNMGMCFYDKDWHVVRQVLSVSTANKIHVRDCSGYRPCARNACRRMSVKPGRRQRPYFNSCRYLRGEKPACNTIC
jgi:hypothetical protein